MQTQEKNVLPAAIPVAPVSPFNRMCTVVTEEPEEMVYDSSTQYFFEEDMVSVGGPTPNASDENRGSADTDTQDEPPANENGGDEPPAKNDEPPANNNEPPANNNKPRTNKDGGDEPHTNKDGGEKHPTEASDVSEDDSRSATEAEAEASAGPTSVTSAKDTSNESGDSPVCMSKYIYSPTYNAYHLCIHTHTCKYICKVFLCLYIVASDEERNKKIKGMKMSLFYKKRNKTKGKKKWGSYW